MIQITESAISELKPTLDAVAGRFAKGDSAFADSLVRQTVAQARQVGQIDGYLKNWLLQHLRCNFQARSQVQGN